MKSDNVVYLIGKRQGTGQREVAAIFRLGGEGIRFKLFGAGNQERDGLEMADAFEAAAKTLRTKKYP